MGRWMASGPGCIARTTVLVLVLALMLALLFAPVLVSSGPTGRLGLPLSVAADSISVSSAKSLPVITS